LVEWQNQEKGKKATASGSLVLEYSNSVAEIDLSEYCCDLQGIFVNLDWEKPKKCLELME